MAQISQKMKKLVIVTFVFLSVLIVVIGIVWKVPYLKYLAITAVHGKIPKFNMEEEKFIQDSVAYYKQKVILADSPKIVLQEFAKELDTNTRLANACHFVAHEIGHAALDKYKNLSFVLENGSEVCNSGYFHGALERYLTGDGKLTKISEVTNYCKKYPSNGFKSWQCFHGIGHGFMIALENELPKAIAECEKLPNNNASSACFNGAYMENAIANQQFHKSKYVDENNPIYPCDKETSEDKITNCTINAPTYYLSLYPKQFTQALSWCETLNTEILRDSCIQGVGYESAKQNLKSPEFMSEICKKDNTSNSKSCIRGFIGEIIFNDGSITSGEAVCKEKANSSFYSDCSSVVNEYIPLFEIENE